MDIIVRQKQVIYRPNVVMMMIMTTITIIITIIIQWKYNNVTAQNKQTNK